MEEFNESKLKRREYRQNGFVYLLDDEKKTAWIKQGHIKRCHRYRLPDNVITEGVCYTVESVEIYSLNNPHTLRHLVIPDSYQYVDEDLFVGLENLCSVHIGKGVRHLDSWHFRNCPKLQVYHIDRDNPYLKYNKGMLLSKDGKTLLDCRVHRPHIIIPEGVEEIWTLAISFHKRLETIRFPKTLRKIGDNGLSNCPSLREVVLPEGFKECVVQCFMNDKHLNLVDFPSTISVLGRMTFYGCTNLHTIILRMPEVLENISLDDFEGVPIETCRLFVPAQLVEQYRKHPVWGRFSNFLPIEVL